MANKPKRTLALYSDFADPVNSVIPPPRRAADSAGPPPPESPQVPPGDNSDLDIRRPYHPPIGIGLTAGELAALDKMAADFDTNRHALLKLAVRLFILAVRAGTIDPGQYAIKTERAEPKNKMRLPTDLAKL